jgi:hypothetical protein
MSDELAARVLAYSDEIMAMGEPFVAVVLGSEAYSALRAIAATRFSDVGSANPTHLNGMVVLSDPHCPPSHMQFLTEREYRAALALG